MILVQSEMIILLSHLFYSGVYQDEDKNSDLYQEIKKIRIATKKTNTNEKTVVNIYHETSKYD